MISPLQPMPIRGVIWYQGESNSGQPEAYRKLLPAMIDDWRGVWGKELPFLFVQIAPHRNTHPAFREAQQRIWESTPRTGMVVTLDVGDAANIHPTRKRPVGERLALSARSVAYGEKVVSSGPIFKSMKIEEGRAILDFLHAENGLVAKDGGLSGFEVAGRDGRFVAAQAAIEGKSVVVESPSVTAPVSVRYAWAMAPEASLFNREGLPAAPFRTDTPK
jgi:sialate O-acetylesterase